MGSVRVLVLCLGILPEEHRSVVEKELPATCFDCRRVSRYRRSQVIIPVRRGGGGGGKTSSVRFLEKNVTKSTFATDSEKKRGGGKEISIEGHIPIY